MKEEEKNERRRNRRKKKKKDNRRINREKWPKHILEAEAEKRSRNR